MAKFIEARKTREEMAKFILRKFFRYMNSILKRKTAKIPDD